MLKQGYRVVKIGQFSFSVSEQNADEFQQEIEQIMMIMKLSEIDVKTVKGRVYVDSKGQKHMDSFSIVGKNNSAGWNITFTDDGVSSSIDLIAKMNFDEVADLRSELENQHGDCVQKRMGGVLVKNNERAMIDLLSKIKYRV